MKRCDIDYIVTLADWRYCGGARSRNPKLVTLKKRAGDQRPPLHEKREKLPVRTRSSSRVFH